MYRSQERSAAEWFAEAKRWHVAQHQGCPNCQARHCVFRSQWGTRTEYQCVECDFSAAHDSQTGRATFATGQQLQRLESNS